MTDQRPGLASELLDIQHGVISRGQALECGMSQDAIRVRVRNGRWQRLAAGVYTTFSGELPRVALIWAGLLAAGPGAAISHQTAAELYQFGRRPARAIHVTVPGERRVRRRPGAAVRAGAALDGARLPGRDLPPLIVHRSAQIGRTRHPVLLPPRTRIEETVADLTQCAPTFDEAYHWLSQACGSRLCTVSMIRGALEARKKVRYRAELAAALGHVADGALSPLEYRYVHGVECPHGLPAARRQAQVTLGGQRRYLDNLYQDYLLAVELDGIAAHPAGERWRDIRRDNSLARLGVLTLRYGWSDVTGQRCAVAGEIAAILAQRGWAGPVRRCSPGCPAAPS
ncbi:MAG TPA: type IV toxin-antitoxin system AbiEi family antitoxin domain-containing protein [Streptosporangiaceae bacterium]